MNIAFPAAKDVGGDLIVASKSLVLLGWAAPAALTARVAIERGLLELASQHGRCVPERASAGDVVNLLYHRHRPLAPHLQRSIHVYGKLSRIAHGADVVLFDAVKLVEHAERFVTDWRKGVAA